MSVSGEPRVLSMTMHGFDDEKVTEELEEGRSSSNNSADSPDSSSRYSPFHISLPLKLCMNVIWWYSLTTRSLFSVHSTENYCIGYYNSFNALSVKGMCTVF